MIVTKVLISVFCSVVITTMLFVVLTRLFKYSNAVSNKMFHFIIRISMVLIGYGSLFLLTYLDTHFEKYFDLSFMLGTEFLVITHIAFIKVKKIKINELPNKRLLKFLSIFLLVVFFGIVGENLLNPNNVAEAISGILMSAFVVYVAYISFYFSRRE